MFAVLRASPSTPLDALVEVAQAFTPRLQVLGPFVLLDVGGLSALFGTPEELGDAIHQACPACRAVALASTAAAALLLACGREGLTVLEPAAQQAALAALPIDVLIEVTQARLSVTVPVVPISIPPGLASSQSSTPALSPAVGWRHPRDTHQAHHTRRPRPPAAAPSQMRQALMTLQQCGATLRRWGILRLGALAALPRPDVHARLGELGVGWQRLACGEDEEPLVPWLAEPIFEELLELDWPIEGFEPLAFVLARLLEPLSGRLERADRGAVAIRTALHLTNKQVHVRVIPLPAPMRDPKTLRTLVLLDLESHPPDRAHRSRAGAPGTHSRARAAVDAVRSRPARARAGGHADGAAHRADGRGTRRVAGARRLLAPGAFRHGGVCPGASRRGPAWRRGAHRVDRSLAVDAPPAQTSLPLAFRRFRLPISVRVRVDDGRPTRLTTDRRGVTGGAIVQAAGPWRTSGEWWVTARTGIGRGESGVGKARRIGTEAAGGSGVTAEGSRPASRSADASRLPIEIAAWDRDEWDIAMADGTVYRLFVEREVGQWFLEGVFD